MLALRDAGTDQSNRSTLEFYLRFKVSQVEFSSLRYDVKHAGYILANSQPLWHIDKMQALSRKATELLRSPGLKALNSRAASMYAMHMNDVEPSTSGRGPHYIRDLTIMPRSRILEQNEGTAVLACLSGQGRVELVEHPEQHPGTGKRYALYPGVVLTVRERSFYFVGHELDQCEVQCLKVTSEPPPPPPRIPDFSDFDDEP